MKEVLIKLKAVHDPDRVMHFAETLHAHAVPYVAKRGHVHTWDGVSYWFSSDDAATIGMLEHHKAVRHGKARPKRGGKNSTK